jgi:diacylglycerol kinase family enzyme
MIKGKHDALIKDIHTFFRQHPNLEYKIHVTRWERDATGYIRSRAGDEQGLFRVHVMGGSSTLYEAANAVIGLPNAQLAAYPMGLSNGFLRYFGDKMHLFLSIRSQFFSNVVPIDAIRIGRNYALSYCLAGLECEVDVEGAEIMASNRFAPKDFIYLSMAIKKLFTKKSISNYYRLSLDGEQLDGEYITIMAANSPCYGINMNPAIDAHPNDGLLDVYMFKNVPKLKAMLCVPKYVSGNYEKIPNFVLHRRVKRLSISSDDVINISLDGVSHFNNEFEYEIVPYAVDFACPQGIDWGKIPQKYGKPDTE